MQWREVSHALANILAKGHAYHSYFKNNFAHLLPNLGLKEWRYPVGSYYENEVDSRNPSVILGFGVWEPRTGLLYGAGAVLDKALIDSEGKPL